ncbi:HIT family protein [Sphingomonas kaistensis]|uniref:HIT family protein n=1 Tax=Sphingomonas kaistensis TaxID=298708 RepID=A0ABZ2G3T7_9SPHN
MKFGYPQTLVEEGRHWAVLVRPAQPTLGSLVLCTLGEETSYGDLSPAAFAEQGAMVARIERTLRRFSRYERINHLMLMMVDPHVHFHIIPRYAGERRLEAISYEDKGWPALPDLSSAQPATDALVEALRAIWLSSSTEIESL